MEKCKQYVSENALPLVILIVAFGLSCFFAAGHNPDSDALFLIENGRYIVQNGSVPTINPWNVTEGMGIILQQWVCSVINYYSYLLLGFKWIWIVAVLMNLCCILSMGFFCRAFSKNSSVNLIGMAIAEICICSFITTRPYQITMSISFLMLGTLFRRNEKRKGLTGKALWKHSVITALLMGIFALCQANYQLAFYPMLFAWPLCFVAPKWEEWKLLGTWISRDRKNPGIYFKPFFLGFFGRVPELLMIYGTMFLTGLCNPYGLSGLLYLPKSASAISKLNGKIGEITSQNVKSIFGVALMLVIIMAVLTFKEKLFTTEKFYLFAGGIFLAYGTVRNTWLALPAFLAMFVTYAQKTDGLLAKTFLWIKTENARKIKRMAIEFLIVISVLAPFILPMKDETERTEAIFHSDAVIYLKGLEKDYKLYTGFNTGAMMEFMGIKVYFDPRPELYSPEITGGIDQFSEWYHVAYEKPEEIVAFLEENGFTHCELDCGSIGDYLLRDHPDYVEIARSNSYVLYERTDFLEN